MMDGKKLSVHVESPAEAEAEGQDRPGSPPPLVLDRSLMREFDAVLERLEGIVDMDRYQVSQPILIAATFLHVKKAKFIATFPRGDKADWLQTSISRWCCAGKNTVGMRTNPPLCSPLSLRLVPPESKKLVSACLSFR
jgi:hypothetical protein